MSVALNPLRSVVVLVAVAPVVALLAVRVDFDQLSGLYRLGAIPPFPGSALLSVLAHGPGLAGAASALEFR